MNIFQALAMIFGNLGDAVAQNQALAQRVQELEKEVAQLKTTKPAGETTDQPVQ